MIKVLIVCRAKLNGVSPFVQEQADELINIGIEISFFLVKRKGVKGYLKSLFDLKNKMAQFQPDLIHVHYGLSGLLANLQGQYKVVTTFHGSDINKRLLNIISSFVALLSKANIFVSKKLESKIFIKTRKKKWIIPCGVDTSIFVPLEKEKARLKLGLDMSKRYILFASSRHIAVKNFSMANHAVEIIGKCELLELSNKTREEVNLHMNACDVFIMTSFSEGSPQAIKEAMACNCPIVSTDVGDVKEVIGGTEGCYICSYEPKDVAEKIKMALEFSKTKTRTNGRQRIIELGLDNETIAKKIIEVYKSVLN